MKSQLVLLSVAAIAQLASLALAATIVVDDRFNDGGITNGADALDVNWVRTNTSSSATYSADDAVFGTGSNVLNYNNANGSASDRLLVGQLTSVSPTLAVGDSLELTADLRIRSIGSSASTGSNAFRVGFANSGGTTNISGSYSAMSNDWYYAVLLNTTTGTYTNAAQLLKSWGGNSDFAFGTDRDFASTTGDTFQFTGTPTVGRLNNTDAYRLTLTLTKTGANTANVSHTLTNLTTSTVVNSFSATDSNTGLMGSLTFDELFFQPVNNDINLTLDRVELSVVPEPAMMSLAALGVAGFLRRRR